MMTFWSGGGDPHKKLLPWEFLTSAKQQALVLGRMLMAKSMAFGLLCAAGLTRFEPNSYPRQSSRNLVATLV